MRKRAKEITFPFNPILYPPQTPIATTRNKIKFVTNETAKSHADNSKFFQT